MKSKGRADTLYQQTNERQQEWIHSTTKSGLYA